jgi:integrase
MLQNEGLQSNTPNTRADAEARRQQVLMMLAQESDLQYAMASDDESDPVAALKGAVIRPKIKHSKPLSRADIPRLIKALDCMGAGSCIRR